MDHGTTERQPVAPLDSRDTELRLATARSSQPAARHDGVGISSNRNFFLFTRGSLRNIVLFQRNHPLFLRTESVSFFLDVLFITVRHCMEIRYHRQVPTQGSWHQQLWLDAHRRPHAAESSALGTTRDDTAAALPPLQTLRKAHARGWEIEDGTRRSSRATLHVTNSVRPRLGPPAGPPFRTNLVADALVATTRRELQLMRRGMFRRHWCRIPAQFAADENPGGAVNATNAHDAQSLDQPTMMARGKQGADPHAPPPSTLSRPCHPRWSSTRNTGVQAHSEASPARQRPPQGRRSTSLPDPAHASSQSAAPGSTLPASMRSSASTRPRRGNAAGSRLRR